MIPTKSIAALILAAFIFVSVPPALAQKAAKQPARTFGNVDGVTAKQLRDYLTFIASDELEGRDTPSRGLDIAAMYIAQHLGSWGIKPAGDRGSYFQKFALQSSKIVPAGTSIEVGGQTFEYGKDFLTSTVGADIADTPVVFVGHGWVVKSKNINPYEGINVKDKIVVVVNSLPKGVTNADLKGPNGGDWSSPVLYAQMNGARAVINFPTFG